MTFFTSHACYYNIPVFFFFFLLLHVPPRPSASAGGGSWSLLLRNIGISAMHMQLLPNDRVVIFDRTDFGPSNVTLPKGRCRYDTKELALKVDCTAHSVEYDIASNSIRPLEVLSDVLCSSGALVQDGSLIQTGGYNDGEHVVRVYQLCDSCDWREIPSGLVEPRWYATNHILPDGRQIVIGGRRQFNYEFYPKTKNGTVYNLPFLLETNDPRVENNLYPFVFLVPDGSLFIFANNRGILFDYSKNQVVKTYPRMPGGEPRNYPSTGSAVLLPMQIVQGAVGVVQVMICGGATKGAFYNSNRGKFDRALDSCGLIKLTDPNPRWIMETMPLPRVMGDILLLPNGQILIINGGSAGTAGWENGRDPVLSPVIYKPYNRFGSRFEVLNPSTIPRMYHSTAILLRDGRVLVGGSNPHQRYVFQNTYYPTELSLEAFSPPYLDRASSGFRPTIIAPMTRTKILYGQRVDIKFTVPLSVDLNKVYVTMVAPSFNTHSFSMNQRLLVLDSGNTAKIVAKFNYQVSSTAPPSGNIAPAGYYLLIVVHNEIPSPGIWVHLQ